MWYTDPNCQTKLIYIYDKSDNERLNETDDFEKYDDDYKEIQDDNFEDNCELESDDDIDITRQMRRLSSSDSQRSSEELSRE